MLNTNHMLFYSNKHKSLSELMTNKFNGNNILNHNVIIGMKYLQGYETYDDFFDLKNIYDRSSGVIEMYQNIFLYSDCHFDNVKNILFYVNGMNLLLISSRALFLLQSLQGNNKNFFDVCIPPIMMKYLYGTNVKILVRYRNIYQLRYDLLLEFFDRDCLSIIDLYLGENEISLKCFGKCLKKYETTNDTEFYSGPENSVFQQYREESIIINSGVDSVTYGDINVKMPLFKIIIAFKRKNNEFDFETLPILIGGRLHSGSDVIDEFTAEKANYIDKHISEQNVNIGSSIYTITFDNGKNLNAPERKYSCLNVFDKCRFLNLTLNIIPQLMEINMTILCCYANSIFYDQGSIKSTF